MCRTQVKTPALHDNTLSSAGLQSSFTVTPMQHCALWRGKTLTEGKLLRMKPSPGLWDFFSPLIKQWSIYHHQSLLYREGTVHSLRACYFHEPFNVASKGIYIIYHSEASQKNPYTHSLPVYCLFFSQALTLKHFFSRGVFKDFFEQGFSDLNFLMGKPYQQPAHTHTQCFTLGIFFLFCPPVC